MCKRAANAGLVDTRAFDSSYLISRAYVDKFKDEVKKKKALESIDEEDSDDCVPEAEEGDAPWAGLDEAGDAADSQEKPTPYAKNWKASAALPRARGQNSRYTTLLESFQ